MQRTTLRNVIASSSAALAGLLIAGTAQAFPVNGQYVEDPRCDTLANRFLTHELGDQLVFPLNESIIYTTTPVTFTVCVPNDGAANDWEVRMTNTSGIAWTDLFFVVDLGGVFGNADGHIRDVAGAPNVLTDAMRIDGTVTAGINNSLLFESQVADEIFAPGEIWRFAVSNYNVIASTGAFAPPIIVTPGIFAGSSPLGGNNPGNSSILATPVPEPTTIGAMGLVAAALLMRRRVRTR